MKSFLSLKVFQIFSWCCLSIFFLPIFFVFLFFNEVQATTSSNQQNFWKLKPGKPGFTQSYQKILTDANYTESLFEVKPIRLPSLTELLTLDEEPSNTKKKSSSKSSKKVKEKDFQETKTLALYLIKKYEGFYSYRYRCPGGIRTIGYGLTQDGIKTCQAYGYLLKYKLPSKMSQSEAERILIEAIIPAHMQMIDKYVKVKLTPKQKAVLISFAYNCGEKALIKVVSGPGRLNEGNYKSIEQILPLYRKANGKVLKGLEKRRAEEIAIWKSLT